MVSVEKSRLEKIQNNHVLTTIGQSHKYSPKIMEQQRNMKIGFSLWHLYCTPRWFWLIKSYRYGVNCGSLMCSKWHWHLAGVSALRDAPKSMTIIPDNILSHLFFFLRQGRVHEPSIHIQMGLWRVFISDSSAWLPFVQQK